MEQSTIEKISQVALMPGVNHIDILPNDNQVWFSVGGEKNTFSVVDALEVAFDAKRSYWISDQTEEIMNYNIYPEGLIISIRGKKEKPSAPTESNQEINRLYDTTESNLSEMVEREA